jgi:hypothetical protein
MSDDLVAYDPHKPVALPGRRCAHCAIPLERRTSTQDHVVGRRFVPEGTLATGFFLQVKACRRCNDRKAALEDDVSVITMLPDTTGRLVRDDERLRRTVARKSRGAISPTTRRLVAQSYCQMEASVPVAQGLSMRMNGLAMPLLPDERVAALAFYHVQGFCHFRSFDPTRGHGSWLDRRRFLMLGSAMKEDWGNPHLTHFTAVTGDWDPSCIALLADGYFSHVMRRRGQDDIWSWALEWNGRMRVFGIYGGDAERAEFTSGMPPLLMDFMHGDTTNGFAMRYETPLPEDQDRLFDLPDGFTERVYAAPHWRTRDEGAARGHPADGNRTDG